MSLYTYFLSIRCQAGCLGVVLYLGSIYFFAKRKDTIQHRLFSAMILASIVNLVFDMITVYTVNHLESVPGGLNHFFHIIFIASIVVILYIIYLYVQCLAYTEFSFRRKWLIPLAIAIPAVLFLPIRYNESPFGNYSGGPYVIVAYACAYAYFVLSVIVLIRRRKNMEPKAIRAIIVAMISMFVVTTIEGIWGEMLISSIGVTLVNAAFFYTVESPDAVMIELLKEEREKAQSANLAKSRFLAQMSHEIRTPINAILGMNEMILHESRENSTLEYAGNIDASGKTLLTIINGILDFSKIEDGKMEIQSVTYDTASVINNVVNSIVERAKGKGLNFQVEIDESLPCSMQGDNIRIEQVIMNLLTNAVKYTPAGSVVFSVRTAEREGDSIQLEVSVRDTGIGIRKEDMERLFEPFERLDTEKNRHIEGTGLGIAITRKLLGMMGSELRVESEYGVGSTFSFLLLQGIADGEPIGDYAKRYRETVQKGGQEIHLQAPGASILVVDDNGMNLKVARNLLKLFGIVPDTAVSGRQAIDLIGEKHYDIVFLDHMMPEMDGIETLKEIRSRKLISETTKMIALTANAVTGARETYLAAGFDDYLSKPIDLERLEGKLQKYLTETSKQLGTETKTAAEQTEEGGAEPEEILEFEPEDGTDENFIEFEPDDGKNGDARSLLKQAGEIGLQVREALDYCGGDEGFYREILRDFAADYPAQRQRLEEDYRNADWQDYRIHIHALKSVSRTIGAKDLSEQARRLEEAAGIPDDENLHKLHPLCMDAYAILAGQIGNATAEAKSKEGGRKDG